MQVKLCYYNQHWNIYLYTTEGYTKWLENYDQSTIKIDSGEFNLRVYNHPEIPIHSFGFMASNPKERPGHGGEWSSNSGQINKVFGTNLYEVAVDQISVAVPMDWLKTILGARVTWEPNSIWGEWIVNVKGEANAQDKWVELK